MYKNLCEFIQYLWEKNCPEPFSVKALLEQLHTDSAQNTEDITETLITKLLNCKDDVDWDSAIFICSEAINHYRALGSQMTATQAVCAIFALCVLSDSTRIDEYLTDVLVVCGILALRVEKEWDRVLDQQDLSPADLRKNGPKIDEDDLLFLSIYLFAKDDKRIPPPLC